MAASTRASSVKGSYAIPASGLAMPTSEITMPAPASLFTAGSSTDQRTQTSDLRSMALCYNCGEAGHLARNCKGVKKCFKCGEPGHSMKHCKRHVTKEFERDGRFGRRGTQSRKLGQLNEAKVRSVFDRDFGDMVAAMNDVKIQEAKAASPVQAVDIPDLIDLSSEPSETSSEDYDPAKSIAKVAPLHISKQLYSKVIEGYSVKPQYDPVVELAEPTLLDQMDEAHVRPEKADNRVEVTLRRKRKGRKGRSTTYDLTPFLSY